MGDVNKPGVRPRLAEWEVGKDLYARPVILRRRQEPGGNESWEIVSEPVSQRDEGEHMRSLRKENLLAIAEVISALGAP